MRGPIKFWRNPTWPTWKSSGGTQHSCPHVIQECKRAEEKLEFILSIYIGSSYNLCAVLPCHIPTSAHFVPRLHGGSPDGHEMQHVTVQPLIISPWFAVELSLLLFVSVGLRDDLICNDNIGAQHCSHTSSWTASSHIRHTVHTRHTHPVPKLRWSPHPDHRSCC